MGIVKWGNLGQSIILCYVRLQMDSERKQTTCSAKSLFSNKVCVRLPFSVSNGLKIRSLITLGKKVENCVICMSGLCGGGDALQNDTRWRVPLELFTECQAPVSISYM